LEGGVTREIEQIAGRLVDQKDEPWPTSVRDGLTNVYDRLNYWRDKCITAANDLRAIAKNEQGATHEGD
jgi:hypothetical protein